VVEPVGIAEGGLFRDRGVVALHFTVGLGGVEVEGHQGRAGGLRIEHALDLGLVDAGQRAAFAGDQALAGDGGLLPTFL
jgi:hypothetical protein